MVEKLGITPSQEQWDVLNCSRRLIIVAGGERAGKSFVSGLFGATRTPYGKRFWIIASTYDLARPEFMYWTENLSRLGAFSSIRDISAPKMGRCIAETKSGQIIETKSADDVMKIAAVAPDGIVMAEAAQMSYETFLKCAGRVAERRGWVLCSGTFEGSTGWYPEKFNEWFTGKSPDGGVSFSLPSWSNLAIYPGGREDPEIKRLEQIYGRVEGMFEERCGAVPVPPTTLFFREFRHTVHVSPRAQFDPTKKVFLAVDPSSGGDPYAVLACQFHEYPYPKDGRGAPLPVADKIDYCFVIDEFYETGVSAEDAIDTLQKRVWWKNVAGGSIDIEDPDERKRWLRYGKVPLLSKRVEQFAGIRRVKSFLSYKRDPNLGIVKEEPHLLINPRVRSLPFEFTHFKRKVVDDDVSKRGIDKPEPNQVDHAVKALWYLLIQRYGDVKSGVRAGVVHTWKRARI